MNLIKIGYM